MSRGGVASLKGGGSGRGGGDMDTLRQLYCLANGDQVHLGRIRPTGHEEWLQVRSHFDYLRIAAVRTKFTIASRGRQLIPAERFPSIENRTFDPYVISGVGKESDFES